MSFNPEVVKGDPLYDLIVELVIKYKPETILEIGSANGQGSTQAFISGIQSAGIQDKCKLYCMEADIDRYNELFEVKEKYPFLTCIWSSTVSLDDYMTEGQIELFMQNHEYNYNIKKHSVETVKGWRKEEIDKLVKSGISQDGLLFVSNVIDQKFFDMVLIDGSAFTALAEFGMVNGAKIIIMDDTRDIKNELPCKLIKNGGLYDTIVENTVYRNGFAAFRRKK
jgi:hypothetical protein